MGSQGHDRIPSISTFVSRPKVIKKKILRTPVRVVRQSDVANVSRRPERTTYSTRQVLGLGESSYSHTKDPSTIVPEARDEVPTKDRIPTRGGVRRRDVTRTRSSFPLPDPYRAGPGRFHLEPPKIYTVVGITYSLEGRSSDGASGCASRVFLGVHSHSGSLGVRQFRDDPRGRLDTVFTPSKRTNRRTPRPCTHLRPRTLRTQHSSSYGTTGQWRDRRTVGESRKSRKT